MEVAGATDVRVHDRRPVRGGGRPSAIEVGLQDGGNRGIGARANFERAGLSGVIDLRVLGINPVQALVVPRVLAATLVSLMLASLVTLVGIV